MSAPHILTLFRQHVERRPDAVAVRYFNPETGAFGAATWRQWGADVERAAAGLAALGVASGDRVGLSLAPSYAWGVLDLACAHAGAVSVAIYTDVPVERRLELAVEAGVCVLVTDDSAFAAAALTASRGSPTRCAVVVVGSHAGAGSSGVDAIDFSTLLDRGDSAPPRTDVRAPHPSDVATIVFTSGTTGAHRAVQLTHGQLAFEVEALRRAVPVGLDDVQLVFLPVAHILGRMLLLAGIGAGVVTAFGRGVSHLVDDLGEVRPTFIGSVPSVYQRLYARAMGRDAVAGGVRRQLLSWAVDLGLKMRTGAGDAPPTPALFAWGERTVFSRTSARLREVLGGRVRFLLSGGAALPPHVAQFFHAAGIPLLNGYGLTETTSASHVTRLGEFTAGSVGRPLDGVECRIGDNDEILVRGPNVVDREALGGPGVGRDVYVDDEGWLHTGDLGRIDEAGRLFLGGRRKELIVTAGGKNVAPGPIERAIASLPLVQYALLVGDAQPFLGVLIALDPEGLGELAARGELPRGDFGLLAHSDAVGAAVRAHIDQVNSRLAKFEQVREFVIIDRPLTVDDGDLTSTRKLRRSRILQRHAAAVEMIYRECF